MFKTFHVGSFLSGLIIGVLVAIGPIVFGPSILGAGSSLSNIVAGSSKSTDTGVSVVRGQAGELADGSRRAIDILSRRAQSKGARQAGNQP